VAAVNEIVVGGNPEDAVAVIGRHERANLSLANDPTVALRHLLSRVVFGIGDRPRLQLVDLRTGQGVEVDGHGRVDGIFTDGPLWARVGAHTLFFIPVTPGPRLSLDDAQNTWARLDELSRQRRPRILGRNSEASRPDGRIQGTLTLIQRRRCATFELTKTDLELGVLIGRYSRCDIAVADDCQTAAEASRVHAALFADGDETLVVDLASTNGTRLNGESVRVAQLGDFAVLDLPGVGQLEWHRRLSQKPEQG
jgi:hypothetical protein